jgi:hypothetical protein
VFQYLSWILFLFFDTPVSKLTISSTPLPRIPQITENYIFGYLGSYSPKVIGFWQFLLETAKKTPHNNPVNPV